MKRRWLILTLLTAAAWGQSMTTVTGLLEDVTQATVTSGKVTFTLTPSLDSTISGFARFSSQTVTCPIAATGNIVSLANPNTTTTSGTTSPGTSVVLASAAGWAPNQSILIVGAGAAGANYVGTVSGIAGTTLTISPATSTSVSGGALVYDPCQVTMNTVLSPPGTFYRVDVWPYSVKTSSFTFYAVLSSYDWSTIVPTPTTSPAQNFVDIFSNQTISGDKTWSGTQTFSGPLAGNPLFTGAPLAGQFNSAIYVGGGITTWSGGDLGAQINSALTSFFLPSGGTIYILPPPSAGCYAISTSITLVSGSGQGKAFSLKGFAPPNITNGDVPQTCLNWTPTSGALLTIDLGTAGSGHGTGATVSDLLLTNGTTYTKGGPGGATTADGIVCGTNYYGVSGMEFRNVTVRGFDVGFLCPNPLSFNFAWYNFELSLNNTPFSITAQNEGFAMDNGYIGVNGNGGNLVSANGTFNKVHFDSNLGAMTLSGSTSAIAHFTDDHFENYNVGTNSCGTDSAEYLNSSSMSVSIVGGEATDDCNTGSNQDWWFNVYGISVAALEISGAGRTPTSVFSLNDGANSSIKVNIPTAGNYLQNLILPNTSIRGHLEITGHGLNPRLVSSDFYLEPGATIPSCAFTSGGGTSPSCAFDNSASNSSGTIILTTGSGSPGSSGTVTLTFGAGLGKNRATCEFAGNNAGAGQWGGLATFMNKTPGVSSTVFQWTNATNATPAGVALSTATAYWIDYFCVGK